MKSKPVYEPLQLDPTAKRHLFFTRGEGEDAARRVLYHHRFVAAQVVPLEDDPVEARVDRALAGAAMDTAFYVAGPEAFLWEVTRALRRAGVSWRRIRHEAAGSMARRVYCVHCETVNHGVTSTVHYCVCCAAPLTVRDHFSRPLGAYMGVRSDVESPDLAPEPEELYL